MILQVSMRPVLCEKSVIDETCKLSVDESELYPDYVVTRAMAKNTEASQNNVTIIMCNNV